jgi:hypothetical protein
MADKVKNQIVVIEPVTDTVSELLRMIKDRDQAEIVRFANADEGIAHARKNSPCMFIMCMIANSDIPPTFNTLKKVKADIKSGSIKATLVSKIKNPQLQKLVQELGITDYIEEPIAARTLQFKANLQLKAVDNFRRQQALKRASEEKVVIKTFEKKEGDPAAGGSAVKPKEKQALQMADDTFLIKNTGIKKNGKKVVVEMDGPDPETGDWVPDEAAGDEQAWRWEPKDEDGKPESGSSADDGWVCRGEKPQFKPNTKKWQTMAEKPELFLKKKKEKVAVKLSMDEQGEISVAADSPAAEENLKRNRQKAARIRKKKGIPELQEASLPEAEKEGDAGALQKGREAKERNVNGIPVPNASSGDEQDQESASLTGLSAGEKKDRKARIKERRKREKGEAEEDPAGENEESGAEGADSLLSLRSKAGRDRKNSLAKLENAEEEQKEASGPSLSIKDKEHRPKENAALGFLQKKKELRARENRLPEERSGETEAEESLGSDALENPQGPKGVRAQKRARPKKKVKKRDKDGKIIEVEEEEGAETELAAIDLPEESSEAGSLLPLGIDVPEEAEPEPGEEAAKDARAREREGKKLRLMEEMHKELTEALPSELPPEQEKRLRKKFNAENRKDVSVEDLVRKERLEKVKKIRKGLEHLEAEQLEDDLPEALKAARADERESRGLNVDVDSFGEAEATEEEKEKRLSKLKKEPRAKREKGEKRDAKDKAFNEDEERSEADEELGNGARAEHDEERSEAKKTQERKLDGNEELSAKNRDKRDSETEPRTGRAADKDLAARASEDGGLRGDIGFEADDPGGEPSEQGTSHSNREGKRSRRKEDAEDIENELAARKRAKREKAEADAKAAAKELEEEAARIASEKEAAYAAGAAADGSSGDLGSESPDLTAENEARSRREGTSTEGSVSEKERSTAKGLENRLSEMAEKSPAMKEFLERRKAREAEGARAAAAEVTAASAGAGARQSSHLGVFVALSDSLGFTSDRKLLNILRAVECTFPNCAGIFATSVDAQGNPIVSVSPTLSAGASVPADSCHVEPIDDGKTGGTLGYLVVQKLAPRENFEASETETLKRAAVLLRPFLLLRTEDKKAKAA